MNAEAATMPMMIDTDRPFSALLRLEAAGVLRARWVLLSLLISVGMVGFFVALASRESAVIGFSGFGRVLTGTAMGGLLFLPLLGIFSTAQAVTTARQQGVLEWYLSHPVSRDQCFWAIFLPRAVAVALPMLVTVGVIGAAAAALGSPVSVPLLLRYGALLAGQGFCFAALGMLLSVLARTPEQGTLYGLLGWMAAVAGLDFALIGIMLRWNLMPHLIFLLAGINPVQAARIGVLAGADSMLGVLGPVGTWIALQLGATGTLAYAIGWPLLVGGLALTIARAVFIRRDVM